jgi:hypothetical protein
MGIRVTRVVAPRKRSALSTLEFRPLFSLTFPRPPRLAPVQPLNRRDGLCLAILAAFFITGLVLTWHRWGTPLVDCGREMQQPLRLLAGQHLYSDIRHIYGPLSPHFNALLFRIFGPSLNTLYGSGITGGIIIIFLTYLLGRRLMDSFGALAASMGIVALCAFKFTANYPLPYSFCALHGCLFALLTLYLLSRTMTTEQPELGPALWPFILAGISAGLASLAKLEMGIAATGTGLVAALILGVPNTRRLARLGLAFGLPALAVTGIGYGLVLYQVGPRVFFDESYLFFLKVPPELVYFNRQISGFDDPLASGRLILVAALKIMVLAVLAGIIAVSIVRPRSGKSGEEALSKGVNLNRWGFALAGLLSLLTLLLLNEPKQWETGPFAAAPVMLLVILGFTAFQAYREFRETRIRPDTAMLIVFCVFAFLSIGRLILRVRSGGAYSSFMLPASVILFVYFFGSWWPSFIPNESAQKLAARFAVVVLYISAAASLGIICYRYQTQATYAIATPYGTMVTGPELGVTFTKAMAVIERETTPDDSVLICPEATSLNFFTRRRNPTRDDILIPGYLDDQGERETISRLAQKPPKLVLVPNRPTKEFGAVVLGRDYYKDLMKWVEERYELIEVISQKPIAGEPHIGDRPFFFKVYRLKGTNPPVQMAAKEKVQSDRK